LATELERTIFEFPCAFPEPVNRFLTEIDSCNYTSRAVYDVGDLDSCKFVMAYGIGVPRNLQWSGFARWWGG